MTSQDDLPPTFVPGFHNPDLVKKMKYSPLGETGMVVSQLSLGASSFGAVFHETDDEVCVQILETAILNGINLIDTAPWYGQGKSEVVLGRALKNIPRNAYYIATKVGRYQTEVDKMFNFTSEKTIQSVEESLQRLGVKYIDIVQLHDVEFCASNQQLLSHTIPALVKLKKAGKIKHIGVTGYPLDILKDLVNQVDSGTISTILTYCRATLFDQELLADLPFFADKGVGVINASPVAMGLLSNRGPPTWHPANQKLRDACQQAALHCNEAGANITKLSLLWTLKQEALPTTLISTASLDNLTMNLDALSETLSEKEEKLLEEVDSKFFAPLKSSERNWLRFEVVRYWSNMKDTDAAQPMDS